MEIHLYTRQSRLEQKVQQAVSDLEGETVAVSLYPLSREENRKAIRSGVSPKRLEAVKQYSRQFGGTPEENWEALKGVSTDEIFHRIREAGGDTTTSPTPQYVSPQRKHAVQSYTRQFGGTLEENMEKLRGMTLEEIHKMIREARNP